MAERNMNYETIIYETEGPLAWITLNRPEKLNAINPAMVGEVKSAMDRAQLNDEVRVILLKGEGRAFCSGLDLETRIGQDLEDEEDAAALKAELRDCFDMIMRFWDSPKPTVSAVHTYCIGAGMELALGCDITLAANECRFGSPEVLFGSGVVAMLLPHLVGPKRAKEILLTGNDRITSEQAAEWGLINRAVGESKLIRRARRMALEIARNDQLAVRVTKQAINNSMEIGSMREAMKHALELEFAIETTQTETSHEFHEILQKHGFRAALQWRENKLGIYGQVMRHEIG